MARARAVPRLAVLALVALGAPAARAADAPAPERKGGKAAAAADAWFAGPVGPLAVEVAPADVERLRGDPRTYVPCRLVAGDVALDGAGVKLKGAAGSFRPVDDRPSLTVNVDRFSDDQAFHGLEKLHLNASVQDESLLHEALAAGIFHAAGLPAPRVTHVLLTFAGRPLGVYGAKEGVDKRFVSRRFGSSAGNLYDGGFCQDLDAPLEKDGGKGPDDRRDLAALVAAARDPDLGARRGRLEPLLDVEAFLGFVALERMLGHWDGYATNRNNYRVYVRPEDGRAVFLPQGMDQLFQDPEAPVLDAPVALLAEAVLEVPAWRARFRARLVELLPLFTADALRARVQALDARLAPAVAALGADAAAAHRERVADLEARLVARAAFLADAVRAPDPLGLGFDAKGRAAVAGFAPRVDEGEAVLDQVDHGGRRCYAVRLERPGAVVASWRRKVALTGGRYTLQAAVACKGVVPRRDPEGAGAGVRVGGSPRKASASGTSPWKFVTFDFEVAEGLRSVELVLELRATAGAAFFPVDAVTLRRR